MKVQSVETSFWNQVVYHAGHTHTTDAPIQSSICLEIALVWSSLHKLYSLQGPSHERKCPASQKHSFVLTAWFQHNSTAIEKGIVPSIERDVCRKPIVKFNHFIFTDIYRYSQSLSKSYIPPTWRSFSRSWIDASPDPWHRDVLVSCTWPSEPARHTLRCPTDAKMAIRGEIVPSHHKPRQFVAEVMETALRFCSFDPKVKRKTLPSFVEWFHHQQPGLWKGRYGVSAVAVT